MSFTHHELTTALYNPKSILDNQQLERRAPSIFSEEAHSERSQKYNFISTQRVLDIFEREGWVPVDASEQHVRKASKRGFQRHCIRLRNFDKQLVVGDSAVEIVLVNSHDGSCAYQLHSGLFRLVCGNGLIVSDSVFNTCRIRHQVQSDQDFIDVSYKVIEDVPKLTEEVASFKNVELNLPQQIQLAKNASSIRWDETKFTASIEDLLRTRTYDDRGKQDLYTVFNILQQNIINGYVRGRNEKGYFRRSPKVKSIKETIRINKALWELSRNVRDFVL